MNVNNHSRRELLALLATLGAGMLARVQAAMNGDPFEQLWLSPWSVMKTPDPWQKEVLAQLITRKENAILCCSRGAGKTEAVAAAAYVEAQLGGFCMVLSRSDRQAMRVLNRVTQYERRWGLVPTTHQTMHDMAFANGGKVVALPCREDTIRGDHGVTLLIIDEAARVPDAFYGAVTPMTAIANGRTVLLSTPFGKRGFFYKEWVGEGDSSWKRHRYDWRSCPRLNENFIAAEVRRHGQQWVDQEYGCEFLDIMGSTFNVDAMMELIDPHLEMSW